MTDIPEDVKAAAREILPTDNEGTMDEPGWIRDKREAIAQALLAERLREREACCAAVCHGCEKGWPISIFTGNSGMLNVPMHTKPDGKYTCQAQSIRNRSQ